MMVIDTGREKGEGQVEEFTHENATEIRDTIISSLDEGLLFKDVFKESKFRYWLQYLKHSIYRQKKLYPLELGSLYQPGTSLLQNVALIILSAST